MQVPLWGVLTVVLLASSYCTTFTEEPNSTSVVAVTGTQVQLRCSVGIGYVVSWRVGFSNVLLTTSDQFEEQELDTRGVMAETTSDQMFSELIISTNFTEDDQINVTCEARDRMGNIMQTNTTTVRVVGPPSTPTNLMATENGVGSLRFSWSSSSIEGVTVGFTLTATNFNTSSITIVRGIEEQHYIFTVEDSSSCDVYTFQVMGRNEAGNSSFSEGIVAGVPSLPTIEESLMQSLVKTESSVTLTVTLVEAVSCPLYPVTSYALILNNSLSGESLSESRTTFGPITATLRENLQFIYYTEVTNEIGTITFTSVEIFTTDVQEVYFTKIENDTYSIQCSYITGSDARGCVYTLVSGVEGIANIIGTIDRSSSEGVQIDLPDVGCYRELLVFDWEGDNSTGTVPIRGNFISEEKCPFTASTTSPPRMFAAIIIIPVVMVMLLILVVTVVAIVVVIVIHRHNNATLKGNRFTSEPEVTMKLSGGVDAEEAEEKAPPTEDLYSTPFTSDKKVKVTTPAPTTSDLTTSREAPACAALNKDPVYHVLEKPVTPTSRPDLMTHHEEPVLPDPDAHPFLCTAQ